MIKDILRVFLPNFIKLFVTIITAFLIPGLLSIEEYGELKIFQLYVSYIGISSLGYCDGAFIKYGGLRLNDIPKDKLANDQKTVMGYQFLWTMVITIGGLIKGDFILVMFGLSFLPTVLMTYYLTLSQALGMFREYSFIYNMHSILTIVFNSIYLFVLKIEEGIAYVAITVVVNYIVVLLITTVFNFHYNIKGGKFKLKVLIENMRMGILIMAGNMAYVIYAGIDKWFIKLNLGLESFSYYAFATQLLAAINMFANPIGYTLFSYFSKKKSQEFEYQMKQVMLAWLFFLLIGVFVINYIIDSFIPKYIVAIPIVIVLFYSQIFYSLNTTIYVNLYKVYKKQTNYFLKLIIIIFLSVVLNCLFFFGVYRESVSCAVATAVCMILWALLNVREFKYLWLKKKDLVFVLGMSIAYFTFNIWRIGILAPVLYFVVYIVLLFYCMPDVKSKIIDLLKKNKFFIK